MGNYGKVNGYDWLNVEAMRYWSFTKKYTPAARTEEIKNAIFGGEYMGALKVDGYYERILKDDNGNIFMIARDRNVNGEIVDKHEWVPHLAPWFNTLPNGTCLLCECYQPGNEGSKKMTSVLGCLKEKGIARQKNNPLHLYVFDCMAYDGVNYDKTPYIERAKKVSEISKALPFQYVEYAKYYDKEALWNKISEYLDSGREGMVIMRKDALVYNKRTPAHISIKIKKEIKQTIDCFFTGRISAPTREYTGKEIETWEYWENLIDHSMVRGQFYRDFMNGKAIAPVTKSYFNHWAGSLEMGVFQDSPNSQCKYKDKVWKDKIIVSIGWLSGLSEEVRANPEEYAFKPLEVTAMEYDDEARTLRHAKMVQWRPDLPIEDCTFEKIDG